VKEEVCRVNCISGKMLWFVACIAALLIIVAGCGEEADDEAAEDPAKEEEAQEETEEKEEKEVKEDTQKEDEK